MKTRLLASVYIALLMLASCGSPKPPEPPNIEPIFRAPIDLDVGALNERLAPHYKALAFENCGPVVFDPSMVLTDPESLEAVLDTFSDVASAGVGTPIGDGWTGVQLDPEGVAGLTGTDSVESRAAQLRDDGFTAMLNILYFLQPQGHFYPVDEAKSAAVNGHTAWGLTGTLNSEDRMGEDHQRILEGREPDRVITIDTGTIESRLAMRYGQTVVSKSVYRMDTMGPDDWTGHGPAIADLIGGLIGDSAKSQLVAIPTFEVEIDPVQGPTRAFTASDLAATLHEVTGSLGDQPTIVNMSFGAKSCKDLTQVARPEDGPMETRDVVYDWVKANPGVEVVAAAGNSATNSLTYPAAWTDDPTIGGRVYSVGSVGPGGRRSCYSDFSPGPLGEKWVDIYVEGDEVWVQHPTIGPAVWSGTSFAAPQLSAAIALGLGMGGTPGGVLKPSDPTPTEAGQCQ